MAKYSAQDRRDLAKKGHALPDGSFPIADNEDLRSAIRNWGLGSQPEVAKKHIIKRAQAMDTYHVLPEKWRDKLEHDAALVGDSLAHFGVKGMKWGRSRSDGGAVQYETAESGRRDSAPKGANRQGVYGYRPSDRLNSTQKKDNAQARKEWEKQTGHTTTQKNFDHNHKDPIRSDYTRNEILTARKEVSRGEEAYKSWLKSGQTTNIKWHEFNAGQTRNGVIALHKTRGEQAVAATLFGAAGLYLSSNSSRRIAARL